MNVFNSELIYPSNKVHVCYLLGRDAWNLNSEEVVYVRMDMCVYLVECSMLCILIYMYLFIELLLSEDVSKFILMSQSFESWFWNSQQIQLNFNAIFSQSLNIHMITNRLIKGQIISHKMFCISKFKWHPFYEHSCIRALAFKMPFL